MYKGTIWLKGTGIIDKREFLLESRSEDYIRFDSLQRLCSVTPYAFKKGVCAARKETTSSNPFLLENNENIVIVRLHELDNLKILQVLNSF